MGNKLKLSKNEIIKLWNAYEATKSEEVKEKIIMYYVPLVKYVADRVVISLPAYLDSNDLLHYGILGLLEAFDRFDLKREIKFETYAMRRIRGAIFDGLGTMDWFSASLRSKMRRLEKAYSYLDQHLGRAAKDQEVADYLGITLEKLQKMLLDISCLTLTSLDSICTDPNSGDKDMTLKDLVEDPDEVNPTAQLEFAEVQDILLKAINKLSAREKLLIDLYYYEELTVKEISKIMGVSNSRISQLHSKAILRLRGSLSRLKKSLIDG